MPLYQQIIMALPKAPKDVLVKLFRNHTKTVLDHGGNVRGIENHGVKPLAERTKRKFATQDGTRYFWEARFITTTFDASPDCLIYINRMLQNEDGYIRVFTKKLDSGLDKVTTATYKNPYFEKPANMKPRNY